MQSLFKDIRYAVRSLIKHPGFTAIAVLTLTLGIGANTAVFSIVNAVLLRPLPYADADRIVQITASNQQRGIVNGSFSYPRYLHLRQQSQPFDELAVYGFGSVNLTGAGEPEQLTAIRVSASLFRVLGVLPRYGRGFLADEDQPGHAAVAILSDGFWQRRFGGDENVIGKTLVLDDQSCTVVGIMPPGFGFPIDGVDLWTPSVFESSQLTQDQIRKGAGYLTGLARLKRGVDPAQAKVEMDAISRRYQQENASMADADSNAGINVDRLQDQVTQAVRPALWVLFGSVAFVLLIGCANVANLSLVRAAARRRELTIRMALGAGRWRLVRQLLTESLLIAVSGGGLGLLLAWLCIFRVAELWHDSLPNTTVVRLDYYVLGFSVGISLITGLLFGLAPAWQNSKLDLNEALKEGARGSSVTGQRARGALVVAEIALSLTLLIGAGLLIRSFARLQQVRLGFNPDHVLTMLLTLPQNKYASDQQKRAFIDQARQRIEAIPGVRSAAFTLSLPLNGNILAPFQLEGQPPLDFGERPLAAVVATTPNYFRTMQIPIVRGRLLAEGDTEKTQNVVVIAESLARRYFTTEDPVGKHIVVGRRAQECEIVGVVGDVQSLGLTADPRATSYLPYAQWPWPRMRLVVRTTGEPMNMAAAVRKEIETVDHDQPVTEIQTMDQVIAGWVTQPRLTMILLGSFAAVALLLAAIGTYGVMSYAVAQRTHEIGIRLALGARSTDVLTLTLKSGMTLALIGVACGLGGSFALTRVMRTLVFGVAPTDALTFSIVSLVLILVSLLACYLPARRATKVDPLVALRYE